MPQRAERRLLSLGEGVRLGQDAETRELVLLDGMTRYRLPSMRTLRDALAALVEGAVDADELTSAVAERGGVVAAAVLQYHLMRLADEGYLLETLWVGDHRFASRIPPRMDPGIEPEPTERYRLSRFAILRRQEEDLVVDSPVSLCEVRIHDHRLAALIGALGRAQSPSELLEHDAFAAEWVWPSLGFLLESGVAVEAARDPEDSPTFRQWESHDLWFQYRSRRGTRTRRYGASFRFRGDISPLPAVKDRMSTTRIALPSPDLSQLSRSDPPFIDVLEGRRSIRSHSERSLTARELGEFLYRSARVRQRVHAEPYEFTSRPHPSGGACYPLEIYPLVHSCDGLEAGLYHYEAAAHDLSLLRAPEETLDELLVNAALGTGLEERPQILLILAARFQRVSWKYESMALATVLKDVGALYQTFYLVATAMGLAPCALGGGNPDLFARATGLDRFVESSVGEFVLGRSADAALERV